MRVVDLDDYGKKGNEMMGKLFKLVLFLLVVGFVGLVGFSYIGDLRPELQETRQPVTLDVD